MNISKYLLICAAGPCLLAACSTGRVKQPADGSTGATAQAVPADQPIVINTDSMTLEPIPGQGTAHMPKAIAYRTTGDYRDNVPVQLNPDGSLLSYPAPTDIPANAKAVELNGGWLLSPVGVTSRSAFTSYTFEQYRALKEAPSPEEMLKAVIPGARVTLTHALPMTPQQALADTAAVNRLLGPTPRVAR